MLVLAGGIGVAANREEVWLSALKQSPHNPLCCVSKKASRPIEAGRL